MHMTCLQRANDVPMNVFNVLLTTCEDLAITCRSCAEDLPTTCLPRAYDVPQHTYKVPVICPIRPYNAQNGLQREWGNFSFAN